MWCDSIIISTFVQWVHFSTIKLERRFGRSWVVYDPSKLKFKSISIFVLRCDAIVNVLWLWDTFLFVRATIKSANAANLWYSNRAENCCEVKFIYQLKANIKQRNNEENPLICFYNCNILFYTAGALLTISNNGYAGYCLYKFFSLFYYAVLMQSKQYRNGYRYILWNIFIISGEVLKILLKGCRKLICCLLAVQFCEFNWLTVASPSPLCSSLILFIYFTSGY